MSSSGLPLHLIDAFAAAMQPSRAPCSSVLTSSLLQWKPTKEGYLLFLAQSKEVYDAFEGIIASNDTCKFTAQLHAGSRALRLSRTC
jgi:hypothetical protein